MRRLLLATTALIIGMTAASPFANSDANAADKTGQPSIPTGFYRLQSAVTLPGAAPDWDYMAFDTASGRLFIARRGDGLYVYDTAAGRLVEKMPGTEGAGATLLIPALQRGVVTLEDGAALAFDLKTLAPIKRIKFAGDADAGTFDPSSGRIAFVSSDSHTITFVDAASMSIAGHVSIAARKLDAAAADGSGYLLVNERDRNKIAKIDTRTMKVVAEWPTTGCTQPTGLAFDSAHHRAFIGCRSNNPVLAVLNTDTGKVVATLPLGRGNDGVVYDAARRRVITTNGIEANIVIYRQTDADHYGLEEAVTTRPNARTMAYDPRSARIFTVTAEGVVDPARKINTGVSAFYPNAYYDGTFTVLTFAPSEK